MPFKLYPLNYALQIMSFKLCPFNSCKFYALGNGDSSVGIVTRWVRASNPGAGKKIFSSTELPYWLRSPPSLILSGYRGYFRELKRPGREVNSSLVPWLRMSGAIPLCAFMAWRAKTLILPLPFVSLTAAA